MWTLSGLRDSAQQPTQNNIYLLTGQWGVSGVEFQEGYYQGFGAKSGTQGQYTGETVTGWVKSFFYGWTHIWLLPYLIVSWGFWAGLVDPKGAPANFNSWGTP
jgi:hypothetical protein